MKPASLVCALIPLALAAPVADANTVTTAEKRGYGSYGSYSPPAGGYGTYGSYKGATGTPAEYGTYPEPAGGYGSYGSYKRAVGDFIKKIFA
jgi:hypothetical protein